MSRNQKALYRVVATTTKGIQSLNVNTIEERDEQVLNFMMVAGFKKAISQNLKTGEREFHYAS